MDDRGCGGVAVAVMAGRPGRCLRARRRTTRGERTPRLVVPGSLRVRLASDEGGGSGARVAGWVLLVLGWALVAWRGPATLGLIRAGAPGDPLPGPTPADLAFFLAGLLVVVTVLVALAIVDARTLRLPLALTRPLIGLSTLWLAALALLGTIPLAGLGRCLLAGAAWWALYRLWRVLSPGGAGVGLGDATLAIGLGLLLGLRGWPHVAVGAALGVCLAGLVAGALLLTRRVRPDTPLPHGPFMIAGTLAAFFAP